MAPSAPGTLSAELWIALLPWLDAYRSGPPILADDELIVNAWIDSTPRRTLTEANFAACCARIAERFITDRPSDVLSLAFPRATRIELAGSSITNHSRKSLGANGIHDTERLGHYTATQLLARPGIGPAVVGDTVALLVALSVAAPLPQAVLPSDLDDFLNALTEREDLILRERVLAARPRTQTELAARIGSSRERVTQLDRMLRLRLNDVVGRSEQLSSLRASVSDRVALVATRHAVCADVVTASKLVPALQISQLDVVCAATPELTLTEDWIVRGSLRDAAAATTRLVTARASPEGVAPVDALAETLGLSSTDAEQWLQHNGFAILGGHALLSAASTADLTVAALGIAGMPQTFAQITSTLAAFPRAESSLRNALVADDRIVKTDRTHYGLTRWGVGQYVPVHRQIAALLDDAGGSVPIEAIVAAIAEPSGVSAASIRAYASSGDFVTRAGKVTRRDGPYRPRKSPQSTRGLYRTDDAVVWRTTVSAAQAKGSAFGIPSALAGLLGVGPGSPVVLESRLGPQQFTWVSIQARTGSIKRFVTDLGLAADDAISLEFGPSTFDVRSADGVSGLTPTARILTLVGRKARRIGKRELTRVLREALWLPADADADAILATLEQRKESELAQLIRDLPLSG